MTYGIELSDENQDIEQRCRKFDTPRFHIGSLLPPLCKDSVDLSVRRRYWGFISLFNLFFDVVF